MIFENPVLITNEVSVHPILISALSAYAFPDIFEFSKIVDRLTDEAIDEVYSSRKSYEENEKAVAIRYHQKLWNLILEKGRDNAAAGPETV